jgi:gas vesicle protein
LCCSLLALGVCVTIGGLEVILLEVVMAEDNGNSFLWFILGLGIGAVAGVLYAPQSGRETRESLRQSAEEGREYVTQRAREARQQANQWVDRSRDVLNKQRDQFSAAVEAGRQAYRDATTAPEGGGEKS